MKCTAFIISQVRAHSQTVSALVAEKTELQAKLVHLEWAAEQRSRDLQEATAPRNEARARIRALEDKVRLTTSSSEHIDSANQETLRQVSECLLSTRTT